MFGCHGQYIQTNKIFGWYLNSMIMPSRAINKIRVDGFRETVEQGKYEISKLVFDPIAQYTYSNYPLLERYELRSHAAIVSETESEYIMTKSEKDPKRRQTQFYYKPGDRFVATVPDAKVIGRKGFTVNQNDRIVVDCVAPPYIIPRRPKLSIRAAFRDMGIRSFRNKLAKPTKKISTASHLLPSFTNYYHWMVENLMKVYMIEKYANEVGEYPELLVPKQSPGWMRESIEAIDYDGKVSFWGNESAKIETLVVPTFPDPVKEECQWLRNRMLSSKNVEVETGNKIFVSRQDASIRRVYNYDKISNLLISHGFDIVVPSDYSVIEQAHIFNNANMIVGPHGAGLTNLLFAEDATVIELWGNKLSTTFERLSQICGHEYSRVRCDTKRGDLLVDSAELITQINNRV